MIRSKFNINNNFKRGLREEGRMKRKRFKSYDSIMNESSSSCTNSTVVDETFDNDFKEITGVDSFPENSSRNHDDTPPGSKSSKKKKTKKKKKRLVIDIVQVLPSSPVRWRQGGVNCKRRRPKVAMAQSRRINGDIENAGFLLGTSLAAFVGQVSFIFSCFVDFPG